MFDHLPIGMTRSRWHAQGAADGLTIGDYLMPNARTPILALASLSVFRAGRAETGQSFPGDIDPIRPTWGGILRASSRHLPR